MPNLIAPLPDLFAFTNGDRVTTPAEWQRRRAELRELILDIEYGQLPPPATVSAELLHPSAVARVGAARFLNYRLNLEGGAAPFWFMLQVMIPEGDGPFPVVINGDACWRYASDEVTAEVLRRGYALATFNRTEIVPDSYSSARDTALYRVFPDGTFGALAAWAWGYHRVVDFLLTQDYADPARIAVVGHSRGGKTVLLAGATDDRIALTAPNNSGSGGAGSFLYQGDECERLADGWRMVPYWYTARTEAFVDREADLPFDQHALKALVAPRALLSTEALGDLWANPSGTYQTHDAAREAYRFLGAEDNIGIWFREGEHRHGLVDWQAFLDFADWRLRGHAPAQQFDANPFPDMPRAFSWTAP
jgi:dienelactone hydrolase